MTAPLRHPRLCAAIGLLVGFSFVPTLGAVHSPVSAATTEYVTNSSVETALAPWSSAYNTSSRVERTTGGYDGTYAVRASSSQSVSSDVGFRDKPMHVTNTVATPTPTPTETTERTPTPAETTEPTPTLTPTPAGMVEVSSALETVPTGVSGDTADDPAIWVDLIDPAKSLVITNEKKAGRLTVFDLSGRLVQTITGTTEFFGNVDVRGDVVAASHAGIRLWRVQPTADGPRLVPAQEQAGNAATAGEGLCMYDPGAPGVGGGLYAINVQRPSFRVRMHPLTDVDADTLLQVQPAVRDFSLASEGEGCVANDATGALYISEEDVGIWKYDLTASGSIPPRVRFASVDLNLSADVEGLALAGGELLASAQNVVAPRGNWYSRYDATTGQHLGRFRIIEGVASDDCDQTDGIEAYAGYLGPAFPDGLFVCQDGYNDAPGTSGTQNFKFAQLHLVDGQ